MPLTSSPTTPSAPKLSHSIGDKTWTPSALLAHDESTEIQDFTSATENVEGPVQVFNRCIDKLADAVTKPRIAHLGSQVYCWEKCSFAEKSAFTEKAGEAFQQMCDVIAPNDGKKLLQAVVDHQQKSKGVNVDVGLQALIVAYQNAPSKSLKTDSEYLCNQIHS